MSLLYRDTLYHGTVSVIEHVDVSAGRDHKDFGQGFYMAVDKMQAIGMMQKKYREAMARLRNKSGKTDLNEMLYEIKLNTDLMKSLDVKEFYTADAEWLEFVLHCREHGGVPHDHDLIIGPTADDDTLLCLKSYWDGLYGRTGSKEAKDILLRNLEPENLGIQYYIGKQTVADELILSIQEVKHR